MGIYKQMRGQLFKKPYFNTIMVVPVGPESNKNFIIDTLNSFLYYNQLSYQIIIVDDSQQGLGQEIALRYSDCETLFTETLMGKQAGLFNALSLAFRHVVENYYFRVLVKMDTNGLGIGAAPQKEILNACC